MSPETRRLINAVLVTMLAVMAFQLLMDWIGHRKGWRQPPQPPEERVVERDPAAPPPLEPAPVDPTTVPTDRPPVTPAPAPPPVVAAPAIRVAPSDVEPRAATIGSAVRNDPNYRLAIELNPRGAAVQQVVLNEFTQEVRAPEPFAFQRPFSETADWTRPFTTRTIQIDGVSVALDTVPWTLIAADTSSATYAVTLETDDGPLARVIKDYHVLPRDDPGAGYEIVFRHTIENLVDRPLVARLTVSGPVTPPREVDMGPDRQIVAGYQYDPHQIIINHHMIDTLTSDRPTIDMTQYEQRPLRWVGTVSVYFVALARPIENTVDLIQSSRAIAFNPQARTPEREAGIEINTTDITIQPGAAASLPMRVFFGPRQRALLNEPYFAAQGYNQILVLTVGMCAVCTFQWLIDVLVWLLRGFYFISRDWGVAIIGLVVLVRLILHPVTKKSQISMMKMAKLGPEVERLRKKYGDNKEELNKAMMAFYKEQGFTPILGCLPMFLQMPIWIALWSALHSTFELRHASFLYGMTWIQDLSKPDHLIEFARPFRIFFINVSGLNLLPILMGIVLYIQIKIQPKPVSMTPQQEQQQKIMMWMMPLFLPVVLYGGPSGLNLYILTTTLFGIIESKIIRDHVKRQEAAEAEQRVLVDAKPTRASKKQKKQEPAPEKKRGVAGWLANLQDRAEQLRREAERKGK